MRRFDRSATRHAERNGVFLPGRRRWRTHRTLTRISIGSMRRGIPAHGPRRTPRGGSQVHLNRRNECRESAHGRAERPQPLRRARSGRPGRVAIGASSGWPTRGRPARSPARSVRPPQRSAARSDQSAPRRDRVTSRRPDTPDRVRRVSPGSRRGKCSSAPSGAFWSAPGSDPRRAAWIDSNAYRDSKFRPWSRIFGRIASSNIAVDCRATVLGLWGRDRGGAAQSKGERRTMTALESSRPRRSTRRIGTPLFTKPCEHFASPGCDNRSHATTCFVDAYIHNCLLSCVLEAWRSREWLRAHPASNARERSHGYRGRRDCTDQRTCTTRSASRWTVRIFKTKPFFTGSSQNDGKHVGRYPGRRAAGPIHRWLTGPIGLRGRIR